MEDGKKYRTCTEYNADTWPGNSCECHYGVRGCDKAQRKSCYKQFLKDRENGLRYDQ